MCRLGRFREVKDGRTGECTCVGLELKQLRLRREFEGLSDDDISSLEEVYHLHACYF